jgi:phosphoribosyl-AMP cyclohydrolase
MIELNFKKMGGLIPAIAQDEKTGEVLMLAFMNRAAWEATLKTRRATYYSRTRDTLWIKGLTSGHIQHVKEIRVDCDETRCC